MSLDLSRLGPDTFRRNGFALLGLPTDAGRRRIRNAANSLITAVSMDDGRQRLREQMVGGLAGIADEPTLREAAQRLQEPGSRLLDELLWFRTDEGPEEHLDGLRGGNYASIADVVEDWHDAERCGDGDSATHNLAVYYHALAVELETRIEGEVDAGRGEDGILAALRDDADLCWNLALLRWRRLLASPRFWEWTQERIDKIGAGRLDDNTTTRLRKELPGGLLVIAGRLMVRSFEKSRPADAERLRRVLTDGAHDALSRVRHKLNPTSAGPSRTRYVIEGDIKGCFDAINHHVLMERVRRRVRDRKVLRLVLAFLKADIMIEGNRRHPVTGTPQGGIISPLLANIYLTAIDERYRRWVPNPRDKARYRAQQRLDTDYKRGRPGFYVVRYADDFVVLVQGTQQDAVQERLALGQFLKEELRMELSMEKTKITDVREGFDFLGYRVAQVKMPSTGRHVGMLFIPKGKSQLLRNKIKVKVRETPTGRTLANLIDNLNPVIIGWRNYYRYATRSGKEFAKHDWWLYWRLKAWLGKKHGGASGRKLRRRYTESGARRQGGWRSDGKKLARFAATKRLRYPDRGLRIPNGWNDPAERFRRGADKFWEATLALASL